MNFKVLIAVIHLFRNKFKQLHYEYQLELFIQRKIKREHIDIAVIFVLRLQIGKIPSKIYFVANGKHFHLSLNWFLF